MAMFGRGQDSENLANQDRPSELAQGLDGIVFCQQEHLISRGEEHHAISVFAQRGVSGVQGDGGGFVNAVDSCQSTAYSEIDIFVIRLKAGVEQTDAFKDAAVEESGRHGRKRNLPAHGPDFAIAASIAATPGIGSAGDEVPTTVEHTDFVCAKEFSGGKVSVLL